MDTGKKAFIKLKKAKEMTAQLIIPKKKALEKNCGDIVYAKPQFKINGKLFGINLNIKPKIKEQLCINKKIDAERNYNILLLCMKVITECENKLNSLIHGPICISSPDIFDKNNCSNWREFVVIPDEEHNPEWHNELDSLIETYETNINFLIEKLTDEKYIAIPTLLANMQTNANKIYYTILGISISNAGIEETDAYSAAMAGLDGLATKDTLKMMAGLPGSA